jgi:hypothetical protein
MEKKDFVSSLKRMHNIKKWKLVRLQFWYNKWMIRIQWKRLTCYKSIMRQKKDQLWWYCTNSIIFSLPYLFKTKPGQFYIILILTIKTVQIRRHKSWKTTDQNLWFIRDQIWHFISQQWLWVATLNPCI